MADLLIEKHERVLTLTMNRPERLNALSGDMQKELQEQLKAAAVDAEIGAIILTGEGRGFCAGGDVVSMGESDPNALPPTFEQRIDRQRAGQELSRLLHTVPKVTIAAINGAAAGAGLGMALACDLRYAKAGAKITTAFAKVAFGGDYGITWGLTHTVGPARAKELLFLSDVLTAEQACEYGMVNQVFAEDTFQSSVLEIASRIAAGPTTSLRWMKENVNMAVNAGYHEMLDRESITHLRCGDTADHKEGVAAFNEKRAPKFTGR